MPTGEGGLKKVPTTKKRHFHTRSMNQIDMQETIDMLGRHLYNLAQLSAVWQEFSSCNTDEKWRGREKTKGLGWQNTHTKLCSKPNNTSLAYNIKKPLLFRSHPFSTLTSHSVQRHSGANSTNTTTTASQKDNKQKEEDRSLFFPSNQPFFRSFSL